MFIDQLRWKFHNFIQIKKNIVCVSICLNKEQAHGLVSGWGGVGAAEENINKKGYDYLSFSL